MRRGLVVVDGHNLAGESALGLVGVGLACRKRALHLVHLVDGQRRGQAVVARHQRVGNTHDLAEHLGRRICQPDVVAIGLAHLARAVGALQQRQRERDLRLHALFLHQLAAGQQIEQLVVAAQLDVGFDHHRVVGLHDGVEELVQRDGHLALVALGEVVALEDARHGEVRAQLQQASQIKLADPIGVVRDLGLGRVENLHGLVHVGLRVGRDLRRRKLRARRVAPGRVADQRSAVADDKRDLVAEVLELAQLAQGHSMPDVQVRARGIHAQLDVKRRAAVELFLQVGQGHELRRAGLDDVQLFVGGKHLTRCAFLLFVVCVRAGAAVLRPSSAYIACKHTMRPAARGW